MLGLYAALFVEGEKKVTSLLFTLISIFLTLHLLMASRAACMRLLALFRSVSDVQMEALSANIASSISVGITSTRLLMNNKNSRGQGR